MPLNRLLLVGIATGLVLSFSPVAFSQPLFAPPVNLGPVINTSGIESDPFWDAPRNRLYFVRNFDIWYAEWNGTDWNSPIELGPQINTGPDFEKSPSVTPDGQKLYFVASARQGFYYDIWVCTFDSSINDWGVPVNLGAPVNTAGAEFSAHLAPDGQHLYFTSEGARECGIYKSEWNGSSWSVPQLQWGCGTPEYPTAPADGKWLYFDEYVADGKSIKAAAWQQDSGWVLPAYDLRQQIGGRAATPYITPSGDSLFFEGGPELGGGNGDIFLAQRLSRGDLNMDWQLTGADVVLEINKVFLGQFYPAPEPVGDMNCDTRFSPADMGILLLVVFAGVLPGC